MVHEWASDFDDGWMQSTLGVTCINLRQYPEAEFHLKLAMEQERNEASLHRNLGRALFAQNKPSDAVEAFRRSLVIEPHHWQAEVMLGNCQKQLGENESAVRHWQRALDLMPIGSMECNVGFLDASVSLLDQTLGVDVWKALLTVDGGEIVHVR